MVQTALLDKATHVVGKVFHHNLGLRAEDVLDPHRRFVPVRPLGLISWSWLSCH